MLTRDKVGAKMFFRIRPAEILLSLRAGPKYASILSRENNCTYSHTVKLLDTLKRFGFVDFEKKGRIKVVKLSEDGQSIAGSLYNVMAKLSRVKEKT